MDLLPIIHLIPSRDKLLALSKEVYIVGGTVRDFLLKRTIKDIDIVVSGSGIKIAYQMSRILRCRFVPLSEEEDQARLVLRKDLFIDIAGMRGGSIEEDLKGRDFTINSMAVDVKTGKFIDPTDGMSDLNKRIIRTLSKKNLIDDPLRILRAFRLMSELEFEIEKDTLRLIEELGDHLKTVAKERIHYELILIFGGESVGKTVRKMEKTGILYILFPELKPLKNTYQKYIMEQNLMEHTLMVVEKLEENIKHLENKNLKILAPYMEDYLAHRKNRAILLMGALFHDIAKPETIVLDEEGRTHFYGHEKVGSKIVEDITKRLRFSTKEAEVLKRIVRHHMDPHHLAGVELTRRAIFRYLKRTGDLAFPLLLLAYSDAEATPPGNVLEGHKRLIEEVIKFVEEEKKKKAKKRLITGYDLIDMGLKPGPIFREILNYIEELQAEGSIKTKEEAIEEVKKYLKERTQ